MLATEAVPEPGGILWVEVALVIFLVVFLVIVVRTLFMRRDRIDAASRIPLDDQRVFTPRDEKHTSEGEATS